MYGVFILICLGLVTITLSHMTEQAWLCGTADLLLSASLSELTDENLEALLAKDTIVATALKLATSEFIISFTCVT